MCSTVPGPYVVLGELSRTNLDPGFEGVRAVECWEVVTVFEAEVGGARLGWQDPYLIAPTECTRHLQHRRGAPGVLKTYRSI